jgi:hypothetical protein
MIFFLQKPVSETQTSKNGFPKKQFKLLEAKLLEIIIFKDVLLEIGTGYCINRF